MQTNMIAVPDETNTAFVNAECIASYMFIHPCMLVLQLQLNMCVEVHLDS